MNPKVAMQQTRPAPWSAWIDAYEQVYANLPARSHVRCPNCGVDALRVAFTGPAGQRVGYASFWCDNCRYGIHLSRCDVPDGVEILPLGLPPEERATKVPNYRIVAPDPADD